MSFFEKITSYLGFVQKEIRRYNSNTPKAPPSPLNKRILGVNIIAVAILGIGFLYLGHYQKQLIDKELSLMVTEANLFSSALLESEVLEGDIDYEVNNRTERFVRRLARTAEKKALLFSEEGILIANSHRFSSKEGTINSDVPTPVIRGDIMEKMVDFASFVLNLMPGGDIQQLDLYPYTLSQRIQAYPNAKQAFETTLPSKTAWRNAADELVLSVAVPVMSGEKIKGVLALERGGDSIKKAINSLRFDILLVFLFGLLATILLSLYLAGTIATPLRVLANAADDIRRSKQRKTDIPDFSARQDEIAMLSESLKTMTEALWNRMDAIERFAADVSHELKNPLTSIKSALETAARITDPEKKDRLMKIVDQDIRRLDRLITDIAEASRIDSELSKAELKPIELKALIEDVVVLYERSKPEVSKTAQNPIIFKTELDEAYILGQSRRLSQVFQNLFDNALSFSPEGEPIMVKLLQDQKEEFYVITVEDKGPGISVDNIDKIFQRFYTERPAGEAFGNHSGLGLNIAKQIIDAHSGEIVAENIIDPHGQIEGCRFILTFNHYKETDKKA